MPITLSNDLTQTVVRSLVNVENQSYIDGSSLSTGQKFDIELIDNFLGSSLYDASIIIGSSIKSLSYNINLLSVASSHLDTITSLIQHTLKTLQSVPTASNNQKAILQCAINSNKQRIENIISSASFDYKKLLQGDVTKMQISSVNEFTLGQTISIKNISGGRLFRTSFVESVNNWLVEDHNRCRYYQSQEEINLDIENNNNLVECAIRQNGAGTGGNFMIAELARAIVELRANNASVIPFLHTMLPETLQSLNMIAPPNHRRDFTNATQNQISTALSRIPGQPGIRREALNIELENVDINLINSPNNIACKLLQDIYNNALSTIRKEQANIFNQKENLLVLADSIRSKANITEKASNLYLSTDYVLAAKSYAENIRKVVSSITTLQANNKIPEAVQNLLSSLSS